MASSELEPPYGQEVPIIRAFSDDEVGGAVALLDDWVCLGAIGDGRAAGGVTGAGAVHCSAVDSNPAASSLLVAPDPTENAAFGAAAPSGGR